MINEEITVQPYEYLKKGFLKPKQTIYRYNGGATRYYYTLDGGFKILASGTTLVKDGFAPDEFSIKALEGWRNKLVSEGKNPAKELTHLANKGTLMHMAFSNLIQGEQIPIRGLHNYLKRMNTPHMSKESKEHVIKYYLNDLRKAILAFIQWMQDYNVEPLATELMIASTTDRAATAVDLICNLDVKEKGFYGELYKSGEKKGQPKETTEVRRVTAIVDFKSGQNFYDSHELQLLLNKRWMAEVYPEIKIEKLYNFSSKDWLSSPTYNFKDQTDSSHGVVDEDGYSLLHWVIGQGKAKHLKKNKDVKRYQGTVKLGTEFKFEDNFQKLLLEEYVTLYKDEVRDVAGEIVEDENLRGCVEIKSHFSKWLAKDLKTIAAQTGMPYKTKPEFVEALCKKYENFLND